MFALTILTEILKGHIDVWYGVAAAVPAGWHICDGTNGTPDLTHFTIEGAANNGEVGTTLGEAIHTNVLGGNTGLPSSYMDAEIYSVEVVHPASIEHLHSLPAATGSGSSYQPTKRLYWIMKL